MEANEKGNFQDPNIKNNLAIGINAATNIGGNRLDKEKIEAENTSEDSDSVFFKKINNFPQEAQEIIAGLSNMFLEKDIYDEYKNDTVRLGEIVKLLGLNGLKKKDIVVVMDYFSLNSAGNNKEN